jgi:hypothetical protein
VLLAKVDVDEMPDLAMEYGVGLGFLCVIQRIGSFLFLFIHYFVALVKF